MSRHLPLLTQTTGKKFTSKNKKIKREVKMFKKRKHSKVLNSFKKMPKLFHTMPGEKYQHTNSEVLVWIKSQDELLNWVMSKAKSLNYIKYDPDTGHWQGIDYQEPCPHGHTDWDDCPDCRH